MTRSLTYRQNLIYSPMSHPDYDTDQTRTIYRNSDGYPLVIYPNGDGTWCDDDGNTYDFANGEDVYDENGVDYYYHGEPAYVRYMPKNQ